MRKLIFFIYFMYIMSVPVLAQDKENAVTAQSGARIVQLEEEIRLLKYKLDEYQSISDKKIWVLTEENKSLKDQVNACADNHANSVSNAIDKGIICKAQKQLDWSIGFMNAILVLITILVTCLLGFNFIKYRKWEKIIAEAKKDCEFIKSLREKAQIDTDNARPKEPSLDKTSTEEEVKALKKELEDFKLKLGLSELLGNPPKAEDYFALGCDKYFSGLYSDALEYFDKVIAINPNNAVAWYNKGVALDELKRYDEAIIAYDKAIAINPNDAKAWFNKGVTLVKLSRYDVAIIAYDKAIAINPNDAKAWINKGVSLCKLKRYDEAIIACDKAIAINPNFVIVWFNKSCAYSLKKDKKNALVSLKRAVELDRDNIEKAKIGKEFRWLRDDPDFRAIVD